MLKQDDGEVQGGKCNARCVGARVRATFSTMLRPATKPLWLGCTSRAASFSKVRLIPFATSLWIALLREMGLKPPGSKTTSPGPTHTPGESVGMNTSNDSLNSAGKEPSRIA